MAQKAVLISIRPQWVAHIANGEKNVEIRKTRPKLETPFKCYIYCTLYGDVIFHHEEICNGKVVGEFTCDEIQLLDIDSVGVFVREGRDIYRLDEIGWKTCLTREQVIDYSGPFRPHGWHISNLIIYDRPNELSEFGIKRAPQSWRYIEEAAE